MDNGHAQVLGARWIYGDFVHLLHSGEDVVAASSSLGLDAEVINNENEGNAVVFVLE
jgi:hypothetical protein